MIAFSKIPNANGTPSPPSPQASHAAHLLTTFKTICAKGPHLASPCFSPAKNLLRPPTHVYNCLLSLSQTSGRCLKRVLIFRLNIVTNKSIAPYVSMLEQCALNVCYHHLPLTRARFVMQCDFLIALQ